MMIIGIGLNTENMKRYKLIQKYPGSFPVGTIVYKAGKKYKSFGHSEDYKVNNRRRISNWIFFSPEYIESYPKFWKKL